MKPINVVPCNGCKLCCLGDAVRILPHEDHSKWRTEPHEVVAGARMLAHKPNRECWYLGETGCTIQDDKPQMCGEMDCRILAQRITFTRARKMAASGQIPIAIWNRGRQLLRETKE